MLYLAEIFKTAQQYSLHNIVENTKMKSVVTSTVRECLRVHTNITLLTRFCEAINP